MSNDGGNGIFWKQFENMFSSEDDCGGIGYKTLITRLFQGENVPVSDVSPNAKDLIESGIIRGKISLSRDANGKAVYQSGISMNMRFGGSILQANRS